MKKGLGKAKAKVGQLFGNLSRESSRSQSPAPPEPNLNLLASAPIPPSTNEEQYMQSLPAVAAKLTAVTQQPPIGISSSPTTQDLDPIPPAPLFEPFGYTSQTPSEKIRLSSNASLGRIPIIVNNNWNTTFNYGRDVINNNAVINNIYLMEEEASVLKTIKSAIGNRFVTLALHETHPDDTGCMPGTRIHILSLLMDWVRDDPMSIFYLAGLAGTGKTSVAITLCRMLQDEPNIVLGGAFFCSRTANVTELTDARCVLPTLAVALAAKSPDFAAALATVLNEDPLAASKPITVQIGILLQRPLTGIPPSSHPIVFVIDAIDECNDENEVKKLLQAISTFASSAKVKFIITSRPETHINASPISREDQNSILRLHTIDTREVMDDIRLYVNNAFSRQPLDQAWYTNSDVDLLAARADGLFIFAHTVVKYVLDTDTVADRMARLQTAAFAMKDSKVATGPLDSIYEFVLTRASDSAKVEPKELQATQQILACILMARMPLSIATLAEIVGRKPDVLRASLRRLHAVVNVPDNFDHPGLRTVHASFGDYLFERAAADLRIAAALGDESLFRGCIQVLHRRLYFNVSQSQTAYRSNTSLRPETVTPSVEYACLQWTYHLAGLRQPGSFDQEINEIFLPRFLFWMELMSVLSQVQRAAAMLIFAANKVRSTELARFLRDANAFVASSREAIERSAPHIYVSALPFAAKDSLIYKSFSSLCTGLVSVETFGIDRHGGRLSMTLAGHSDAVNSVAYTADGRIASGSRDGTVRIWDARTGDESTPPFVSGDGIVWSVAVSPTGNSIASGTDVGAVCIWSLDSPRQAPRRLTGHSRTVNSLAFSPDGLQIASASDDGTVRLWGAEMGQHLSAMSNHQAAVTAVAFSPNGQMLASGSRDETVRLWKLNRDTPTSLSVLDHDAVVSSVCFSPDNITLATGLWNSKIEIWEISTELKIKTLRGHSHMIRSVQFSSDGRLLVSASFDETVRLWYMYPDAGDTPSIVLRGHPSPFNSAMLSSDSNYVASGLEDGTIKIWDASSSQTETQPFEAHNGRVLSVAISADGTLIVSGSEDCTVRIWDAHTGQSKSPSLTGHTLAVCSVAISPDGQLIATASEDATVRLWHTATGDVAGKSLPGHGYKNEVIFSPDSRWLASGLGDGKICFWDVETQQPFEIGPLRDYDMISSIAFSPDGGCIAVGDSGGTVDLWRTDNGQLIRATLPWTEDFPLRFPIAFSPAGMHMVCGVSDMTCRIWVCATGQQIHTLDSHTGTITSVAYSPDGHLVGTGSEDSIVRLWDAATGGQLAMLHGHTQSVESIAFTPDNQFIVSGSDDCVIRVWDVETACSRSPDGFTDPVTVLESTGIHEGWLLGPNDELLLWIPEEYRAHIELPACRLLIATHRIRIAAQEEWHHGNDWMACWCGAPAV